MKRYKRIILLTAVLAVVCIAIFGVSQFEQTQEQIRASEAILLEIPKDTVTAVSWQYATGDGLAFRKTEGVWKYEEDAAFPVSEEKLGKLLSRFEAFSVTFTISEVTDYAQYGLEEPECVLTLETAEKTYTIKLGAFSKMDQQRYIDIGDGKVYLVEEDPLTYLDASLSSMIQHDDTPGFETVVDITFTGEEGYTIVREAESAHTYAPEADVYFVERDGKTLPLNTPSVKAYLNTITALDLMEYVTYNATEEELKACGLDAPLLSVTVNYTYTEKEGEVEKTLSDTCVIHISEDIQQRADADKAEAEGNTPDPVTKYVRIGDSPIVYTLEDTDFAILRAASYDDLRHKEVFWGDFEKVTRMDITLEGQTHALTSRLEGEGEDAQRVWYYGEAPAQEAGETSTEATAAEQDREGLNITRITDALEDLSAERFTDEAPGGKEEICLTLHLDQENFPTVEIRLYRYDGDNCLAVVDGQSVSLVSRSDVMDLVEGVQTIVLSI